MFKDVEKGFRQAKKITKAYAKTYYFASHLLSPKKRLAAYVLYAVCRISDDSIDAGAQENQAQKLKKITDDIASAYGNAPVSSPLLLAFNKSVGEYAIPRQYFDELIQGMRMDTQKNRYLDFNELYDYCYKVAGVIGLIMLEIFGYKDPRAKDYALNLGIAMQLTNILRDIKEDFARGRIYLPLQEIKRYGVSESDISIGKITPAFKNLLAFQIKRARQYYAASEKGIKMLKGASCRLTASLMKDIYCRILDSVEKNNYDVFSKRAYTSGAAKTAILLKTLLSGRYL